MRRDRPRKQFTEATDIRTIGLDLGDTRSTLCVIDPKGRVVSRGEISTTRAALTERFGTMKRARIVLEACGQSTWIARTESLEPEKVADSSTSIARATSPRARRRARRARRQR
jgi:hypothetical protein